MPMSQVVKVQELSDKYSFTPGKLNTKPKKNIAKAVKRLQPDLPSSNLQIGKNKNTEQPVKQKEELDLQYLMPDGVYITINTPDGWCYVCPFTGRILKDFTRESLFVISLLPQERGYALIDTSIAHCRDPLAFMRSKNAHLLTPYVAQLLKTFGGWHLQSNTVQSISQQVKQIEMKIVPQTAKEFRNSQYYCLPTQLRKYDGLKPGFQPLFDWKGQPVYSREAVTELHTRERWLKYRREVYDHQEPIKVVKGMYNDPQRLAELYGYWQTKAHQLTLDEDGLIPRNKYGNIELFNGPLPPECLWIDQPRLYQVCKQLQVDFVPAVTGFERSGAKGFSHPVVKGAVVLKTDVAKITERCESLIEEMEQKKIKKDRQMA